VRSFSIRVPAWVGWIAAGVSAIADDPLEEKFAVARRLHSGLHGSACLPAAISLEREVHRLRKIALAGRVVTPQPVGWFLSL